MSYHLILVTISTILISTTIQAQNNTIDYKSHKKFAPRIELSAKKGITGKKDFKRDLGRLGFVMPLTQNNSNMLFLTMIGMKDSKKSIEGNFGLGYRRLNSKNFIIGGYAFYDLRNTKHNNNLHQATVGLEFMTTNIETRLNVYIPFNQHIIDNYNIYDIRFDSTINYTTLEKTNQQVIEKGLAGFDIEIGGSLPKYNRINGFIAFYRFAASGTPTVTGYRIRTNYIVSKWLSLEIEANKDKVRGLTSYAGINLNWDFNTRKHPKAKKYLTRLERKMTQLPVRDIDVVSSDQFKRLIRKFKITRKNQISAVINPGPKDQIYTHNTTVAKTKAELFAKLQASQQKTSDIFIEYIDATQIESVKLASTTELSFDDAELIISNIHKTIPKDETSKQLRLKAIEKKIKSSNDINNPLDKNLVDIEEIISDPRIDNTEIAKAVINSNNNPRMKKAIKAGIGEQLAKIVVDSNDDDQMKQAITNGLEEQLANEIVNSSDDAKMTKAITNGLGKQHLAKAAVANNKETKAINAGLQDEVTKEVFATKDPTKISEAYKLGLKDEIINSAIDEEDIEHMVNALNAELADEITDAIIDRSTELPDTEFYIENQHMEKLFKKYLEILGLSKDNTTSIKAFDGSIVAYRSNVSGIITANASTSNIRKGFWEAIADSLMQQLSPKKIKVLCTINHMLPTTTNFVGDHWTSSVTDFDIDEKWYANILQNYNKNKTHIESTSSIDVKRLRIFNMISDVVLVDNIENTTKLYGVKSGKIKHYDSLNPGNKNKKYFKEYEKICEPLLQNNNNISLESKSCIQQDDYTCGDHSLYNGIHDSILGLDVEDKASQISSMALRALTEITDQNTPLATVNEMYAVNLSLNIIEEYNLVVSDSSEELSKIAEAKIIISKQTAIEKFKS